MVSITYVMRQKRRWNNLLKTEPCLWMGDLSSEGRKSMLQHRCTCTLTDVTNRTWRYSKRLCVHCSTSGGSGDTSSIFIYVSNLTSYLIRQRVFFIRLLPINIIHLVILGLAQKKGFILMWQLERACGNTAAKWKLRFSLQPSKNLPTPFGVSNFLK